MSRVIEFIVRVCTVAGITAGMGYLITVFILEMKELLG